MERRENAWTDTAKCYKCGGVGHTSWQCANNKKQRNEGQNAHAADEYKEELEEEEGYSTIERVEKRKKSWILDGGASSHHTGDRELLYNIKKLTHTQNTNTGNGVSTYDEMGDAKVKIGNKTITLNNVLYVPGFKVNLISVSKLTDKGCIISYSEHNAVVKKNGKVVFVVPRTDRLYSIQIEDAHSTQHVREDTHTLTTQQQQDTHTLTTQQQQAIQRLHEQYGHISYTKLYDIISNDSVDGVSDVIKRMSNLRRSMILMQNTVCDACMKGKMHRLPMTGTIEHRTQEPLDHWASDLMGPMRVDSLGGAKYILIIIDVHTRYIYMRLLKHKSEATKKVIEIITQAQTQHKKKLKRMNSDGGGEFVNNEMDAFMRENGTIQTTTTAHTPQYNAIVERANRTIIESVRAMMCHTHAHLPLWGEATATAVYLLCRSLTKGHPTQTPNQTYKGIKPNINNLHVFGCDVYYHVHKEQRQGKLDEHARKGIFVGYDIENSAIYRIYDVERKKVVISRDVRFYDNQFTEMKRMRESEGVIDEEKNDDDNDDNNNDDNDNNKIKVPASIIRAIGELFPNRSPNEKEIRREEEPYSHTQHRHGRSELENTASDLEVNAVRVGKKCDDREKQHHTHDTESHEHDIESHKQSDDREKQHHTHDTERHEHDIESHEHSDEEKENIARDKAKESLPQKETQEEREETGTRKSNRKRKQTFTLSSDDYAEATNSGKDNKRTKEGGDSDVPQSYDEAVTCDEAQEWKKAIKEETESHIKNGTWKIVKKEKNINIVTTKWVFVKKKDEYGNVLRYKARWVARGFTQEYGIDYEQTFAPVLKGKSIRIIMSVSASPNSKVVQLDFKTAYLNASVKEDIYVTPPPTIKVKQDEVMKLVKALYGLKQSGREWNLEINKYLLANNYTRCVKDTCIYIKQTKTSDVIIIGLYVDDIVISYDKKDEEEWLNEKKKLMSTYELTDIGPIKHLLGIRFSKERDGTIYMDQQAYIKEKLNQFKLSECKSVTTPGDQNIQVNESDESADAHDYRSMVGSLIYASTWTRPDITHAVNMVSRYMQTPTVVHQRAATKILRYLSGTSDFKLKYNNYNNNKNVVITGYCDADWGGDKTDRKSTTGYCVYVNDNLVSWNAQKQHTVALSTAEAELMAMTEVMKEVAYIEQVLGEMKYVIQLPTAVFSDNQAAVQITHNDVNHDRTKHIAIRHLAVRDSINNKQIDVKWLRTDQQIADIFTKSLNFPQFNQHRQRLIFKKGLE